MLQNILLFIQSSNHRNVLRTLHPITYFESANEFRAGKVGNGKVGHARKNNFSNNLFYLKFQNLFHLKLQVNTCMKANMDTERELKLSL